MARLFITQRELNYISDLNKEIIKDINGQQIIYYPISELKSEIDDVYDESIKKVFDQPIAIDALVDAQFQEATKIDRFGVEDVYKIEAYIQYRDMIDKKIELSVGDFFSFGDVFYEITNVQRLKTIFGQAEHKEGFKISGTKSRETQFSTLLKGPTDIKYTDDDAVQKKFVQQRGFEENENGLTGDKRELIEQGVLDEPLTGAKQISEKGAKFDDSNYESSFYDGED